MQQCTNCRQFHPDDTIAACPYCGTPYGDPASSGKTRKKKPAREKTGGGSGAGLKKLGLIAGLGLGAAALIAVIIFAVNSLFGTSALGTAAGNSIASLAQQLNEQSDLASCMASMESLSPKSDCHIVFGVRTPEVFVSLDADHAGSKKRTTGTVEFGTTSDELRIGADFHADKKELRIYAPDLVTDIYGFKFSDFEKKYDKSPIRKVLNLPEAADLKLLSYQKFDLKKFLKEQGGDSWKEFEKTLEIEEFGTRQIALGSRTEECTIYRVQWDAKKAERLLKTIARNTLGILPDFIPELANKIAPDVRFYVNAEEQLVGVDFSFLHSIYTFLLEGEDNPWEQASLKIVSAGAEPVYYYGGVVSDAEGIRIELKAQDQTMYAVRYDSSTGGYSVMSPAGELASGVLRSIDGGFHLECDLYGTSYTLSVSALDRIPEDADEKYTDIFDMNISQAGRLVTELSSSLSITTEDLLGLLNSLFGG